MKKKLKYQGGITKRICLMLAASGRKKFRHILEKEKSSTPIKDQAPDFDIISFSGVKDFEEQVLSLYSFVTHVGIPRKWTIYSDGSHGEKEKRFFIEKFPFTEVRNWNENHKFNENPLLKKYLDVCHLSKKLSVILGHTYGRQTIYADSDIVFYPNASAYFNSDLLKEGFWYMADTNWGSTNSLSNMFYLNSGLMILNKKFNFDLTLEYLSNLNGRYDYFSEQSSFDYSFKKQNASILDPRQFVVNTKDQFDFGMAIQTDCMAIRHYVNPVRHKMWQKGWRWHFNL